MWRLLPFDYKAEWFVAPFGTRCHPVARQAQPEHSQSVLVLMTAIMVRLWNTIGETPLTPPRPVQFPSLESVLYR